MVSSIQSLPLVTCLILSSCIKCTPTSKGMDPHTWRTYIFNQIYEKHCWENNETISGPGSTIQSTATLRLFLPVIIQALGIKTMLDAGCGDLNWIKETPLGLEYYIGIDIVTPIIEKNIIKYSSDWCQFLCLHIAKDPLPHVDLIFCRDVLQHLSFKDVCATINNFKKTGAQYLMTSTYPVIHENTCDITTGNCHYINFQKKPFSFPEPIIAFDELSAEKEMIRARKRMCVWRLSEILTD
jgi:hypothetical protein